jgi:hypothetical protein
VKEKTQQNEYSEIYSDYVYHRKKFRVNGAVKADLRNMQK